MGATLIVKRKGGGFAGTDDYVNLRVDDSTNSINELKNLYARWRDIRAQQPGSRILEQARGEDVKWLQRALLDLGYLNQQAPTVFNDKGEPLGVFNDVTAEAVARYKRDRGLGATPSAGLETINAMRKELGEKGGRQ
jgi:peptidoglycan hydrolase-like protein with peptidoglycan-binding domain